MPDDTSPLPGPRLSGVRVWVTRPRERSQDLCFLLEDEGAEVTALPLLELVPPDDPRPLRAAAERIERYHWIVFSSPSAVQALVEAVREAGSTEHLYRPHIAAVGPKTAQAVREYGLAVIVQPEEATGAALFEALRPQLQPDQEILLPVAQEGRRELGDALEEHGFRVTRIAAYRSVVAQTEAGIASALASGAPGVILFGSPRTAEAFLEVAGPKGPELMQKARIVAIGPTTASGLQRLGFEVAAIAERPSAEGLVEAAIRAVHG
ncbi:MAG: uroporphyrinogen-III synthase [Myxococcaceae bacterium]|nr:uroporphyrinogen-III synthase [Myxococcaceae bacterium]